MTVQEKETLPCQELKKWMKERSLRELRTDLHIGISTQVRATMLPFWHPGGSTLIHNDTLTFFPSWKKNMLIKTVAICSPWKKTVWQPIEIWIRFEKVSHDQGSQSESEMTFWETVCTCRSCMMNSEKSDPGLHQQDQNRPARLVRTYSKTSLLRT